MLKPILSLIIATGCLISSVAFAGSVDRSIFTSGITDREPVDRIDRLENGQNNIFYFTELRDLQGQNVTHQWVYDDQVVFEKSFPVGGDRWRVWSSKTLQPGLEGLWYVFTLDQERNKIHSQSFEYQP